MQGLGRTLVVLHRAIGCCQTGLPRRRLPTTPAPRPGPESSQAWTSTSSGSRLFTRKAASAATTRARRRSVKGFTDRDGPENPPPIIGAVYAYAIRQYGASLR